MSGADLNLVESRCASAVEQLKISAGRTTVHELEGTKVANVPATARQATTRAPHCRPHRSDGRRYEPPMRGPPDADGSRTCSVICASAKPGNSDAPPHPRVPAALRAVGCERTPTAQIVRPAGDEERVAVEAEEPLPGERRGGGNHLEQRMPSEALQNQTIREQAGWTL